MAHRADIAAGGQGWGEVAGDTRDAHGGRTHGLKGVVLIRTLPKSLVYGATRCGVRVRRIFSLPSPPEPSFSLERAEARAVVATAEARAGADWVVAREAAVTAEARAAVARAEARAVAVRAVARAAAVRAVVKAGAVLVVAVRAAVEKVGAATAEGRAAARVAAARGLATGAVATAEEARVEMVLEMVRLGGSRKGEGGRKGRGGDRTGDNVAAAVMELVARAMTVEREGMVAGSAWTARRRRRRFRWWGWRRWQRRRRRRRWRRRRWR